MARRSVLEYPDERLRVRAVAVEELAPVQPLIDELIELMTASKAIGLAAPQVGEAVRVVVTDVSGTGAAVEVFVNPEVLSTKYPGMVEESCLSVPGIVASVPRATWVQVRHLDRSGELRVRELEGLPAVCLLHELDHLDGTLFIDRLPWFTRLRLWRPLRDARRARG
jgi:peptide deformylase